MSTVPEGGLISGYRVQRVIGSGAMGTVYAVQNPALPRTDALKLLSSRYSADPQYRARFLREADIAATLDHPNIVSIYDRGQSETGQLWIAMQYIDGTDADAAIQAGAMPPERAVHIIAAIGNALDYAHQHRIIHRDIKPANFLLTGAPGPHERVLLADFGIARGNEDTGTTATGAVIGTIAYTAPEVTAAGHVDYRSDLYSLGCAFYHLLTGHPPYAHLSGGPAQALAHLNAPPPRVTEAAPRRPPAKDAVIARAMAKDPAQRFTSGREMAQAAQAIIPPPAHNTGPAATVAPKRRKTLIVSAIAATALLAAGTTTAIISFSGNDNDNDNDNTQAQNPTSTITTTPGAPPLTDSQLSELLLSSEQLSAIVGVPLTAGHDFQSRANNVYDDCGSALYPGQRTAYENSGATDIYGKQPVSPEGQPKVTVIETVNLFKTAELAQTYVVRRHALLTPCDGRTITQSADDENDEDIEIQIGATQFADDILVTDSHFVDNSQTCQHALTAANNIVVDVTVCGENPTKVDAVQMANQIAGNVEKTS